MSSLNGWLRAGSSLAMAVSGLVVPAAMAQVETSPVPASSLSGSTTTLDSSEGRSKTPAAATTNLDTSGDYQHERQACNAGQTAESRELCIREAEAAQAERKRGTPGPAPSELAHNALARCAVQKDAEDRAACEARVLGHGSSFGSIEGGGVLREIETVVVPPGQDDVRVVPEASSPTVILPPPPPPPQQQQP
jgi:hypothetical protein